MAISGEGLSEALEWLYRAILEKKGVIMPEDNNSEKEICNAESTANNSVTLVESHWSKAWELLRALFIAS